MLFDTSFCYDTDRERERGASRDLNMSDSDEAAHYPGKPSQSPPMSMTHAPAPPKSYVEELTAATTTSRRMSMSNLHMYPLGAMVEYAHEDDDNLYDEAPRMQMQPLPSNRNTVKRRNQAPVTMKMGSKFMSVSSGGNPKAEKTVTSTAPELTEERLHDANNKHNNRPRTLLRRPSSTPVAPTTSTSTAKPSSSKASKRQSFAMPAQSTSGMFNDRRHHPKSFASAVAGGAGSVKSSDEEDNAGDMLAGSSLRRRSLLTMLQDEVFEELNREHDAADGERYADFAEAEPEEEEEEEEHYDEYGNPVTIGKIEIAHYFVTQCTPLILVIF